MPIRINLYKSRDKARSTRNAQRLRYYQKTQLYSKRRLWTSKEDKAVLEHSISDTQLSTTICRSVGAIQARRSMLKKKNRE